MWITLTKSNNESLFTKTILSFNEDVSKFVFVRWRWSSEDLFLSLNINEKHTSLQILLRNGLQGCVEKGNKENIF